MTDQPSRDDLLDEITQLKTEIVERFNRLTVLMLLFSKAGDKGAAAVHFGRCTSTQWATTMAAICDKFGPEAIEPMDPLDMAWWRPLTQADNPGELLKRSRNGEWNAARNRKEAGTTQKREPPWYDGGVTIEANGGENYNFQPDMQIELKGRKRFQAKLKEVDE